MASVITTYRNNLKNNGNPIPHWLLIFA